MHFVSSSGSLVNWIARGRQNIRATRCLFFYPKPSREDLAVWNRHILGPSRPTSINKKPREKKTTVQYREKNVDPNWYLHNWLIGQELAQFRLALGFVNGDLEGPSSVWRRWRSARRKMYGQSTIATDFQNCWISNVMPTSSVPPRPRGFNDWLQVWRIRKLILPMLLSRDISQSQQSISNANYHSPHLWLPTYPSINVIEANQSEYRTPIKNILILRRPSFNKPDSITTQS
jgi:hypothetical protein